MIQILFQRYGVCSGMQMLHIEINNLGKLI